MLQSKHLPILKGLSERVPVKEIKFDHEEDIETVLGMEYGSMGEVENDLDEITEKLVKTCSNVLDKSDEETIKKLIELANRIKINDDSKLEAVANIVDKYLNEGRKVIIFTEYKDTLEYLKSRFKQFEDKYGKGFFETISGRDKNRFEEVKENFEGGKCNLLIATDVASEGLNLQVANIVINYEAPWSPIKLEQRIGRVWRLGQREDINIYTAFMATNTDVDVMENLYGKLLAMKDALDEVKPLLGETVQIARKVTATASGGLWEREIEFTEIEVKGERKKVNEYKLILASLKGKLSQYVKTLLHILSNMHEELARKSIYQYVDPNEIKHNLKNRISTSSAKEYEKYSRELCQIICEELEVEARRQEICKGNNPQRIWELIKGELKKIEGVLKTNIFFTPAIKPNNTHYLFKVNVNQDGKSLFEELVLYMKSRDKIIYGADLLRYLVKLFKNSVIPCPSTTDISQFSLNIGLGEKAKIKRKCRDRYRASINNTMEYLYKAFNDGYRNGHYNYNYNVDLEKLAIFVGIESKPENIPENVKKKIEEAAMELVMKIEKEEGMKPDDSPAKRNEHYDIYSYNPETGEERFIEVKGTCWNANIWRID
ncbi:MAG: helicase-related protein [Candidatus Aenigmatarchaeota archaeon]